MSHQDFSWMNHPSLKNIDAAKLQMLMSLADQGKGKSQNELLPFLMAAATQSKANGTAFSQEETDLIIQVLKQGRPPEEAAKIDNLAALIQKMRPRR